MSKIRVLVADDHTIVREGVRMILESLPDMEVVGEASDGDEAIAKVAQLSPDAVIMDIGMPGTNGLEATSIIKKNNPNVQVLVLTMHDTDDYFFRVLKAGASGYVLKGASSADLIYAIRAAHDGNVFLYPSVAKRLINDYLQQIKSDQKSAGYASLSDREKEVLKLIADGRTNQEIADILSLSPSTVQSHCAHIMGKLNLQNRAELMKYAIRRGLIDDAYA